MHIFDTLCHVKSTHVNALSCHIKASSQLQTQLRAPERNSSELRPTQLNATQQNPSEASCAAFNSTELN